MEDYATSFVPKDSVALNLGKHTLYVYPSVTEDMSYSERSYAFMVNKSALESADLPIKTRFQVFGDKLGATSLMGIFQARYHDHALSYVRQATQFQVLSYHSLNGRIMATALDEHGQLRGTTNQTNANRRPEGINYAKISCDIVFTAINAKDTQAYPFTFFIRLFTEDRDVPNTTQALVHLNTFHGPNDWATSLDQAVIDAIWDSTKSLKKPFWLTPPAINDANADAQIEFDKCTRRLEDITLQAAWPFAVQGVFQQTCPNFVADPASVIQGIHQQSKKPGSEEKITLTIAQYFKSIQTLTNFLPKSAAWTIDVVQHFITHTTPDIRQQMQSQNYFYDAATSSKSAFDQIQNLQKAFATATLAEQNLQRVRDIANDALAANHAFHINVNTSRAEATIKKHSTNQNPCWGCGQVGHSWADRDGNLFCPQKDNPECQKKAAAARIDFVARSKKKNQDKTAARKRQSAMSTLLEGINQEDLKALITKSTKKAKTNPTTFVLMNIMCLPVSADTKPLLPISIDTHLPHFEISIGPSNIDSPFKLSIAYDTCAVTNVGWSTFHLAIAKQYPQLIKSLIWAKDKYTPLTLSGVVSSDSPSAEESKYQTVLPAIIEYHLPYLSTQGSPTSFKVAIGPNVAVNTIIGMSMIKAGKFSLDVEDDIIDSGVLDTTPFPVTYKPTIRSLPNVQRRGNDDAKTFATVDKSIHVTPETVATCMTEAFNDAPKEPENSPLSPPPTRQKTIIVPKQKWTAKTPSVWKEKSVDTDNDNYQYISQQQLGFSLRKKISNLPAVNPETIYKYNKGGQDEQELLKNLVFDNNVRPDLLNRIKSFVIEFWDVFREAGVSTPVRNYEMVIDTGDHKPIAVRKPHYGLHESPIMQKTIDTLLQLGHIAKDRTSPWGFRITLAPKPHQEDVTDIEQYVWRFCINFILLNKITRPAEYPIPRCDDAVMYGFGIAVFFILLDAFSGYHQVRLSPASTIKTAFYAPQGRKYIYLVMPFGIRNAPTLFLAMMHDLRELWTELCSEEGIQPSDDEGSTIIMDDTFLFAVSEDNAFIILRCVCLIARKYNLTWKLKKCRWFPETVEFVGVDIHKHGNSPASSKKNMLANWKLPKSPRDIMSFIGFAMFYARWINFFEIKITPLRALISTHAIDHVFLKNEFTQAHEQVYDEIRTMILSAPILQRANIRKRFYLKTDFSALGLGFALCQPDNSDASLQAMKREDAGGECEFDLVTKAALRLLPIAFGSRRTIGNEKYFHSHPGEALAATWGILKNRHFLWGRPFTLISDCKALLWITSYRGNNNAVVRLQLELTGYWFTVANRPGRMLADADYFSRLGADIRIDPLLGDYLSFARQLYANNTPPQGELDQDNLPGRRKKSKVETDVILAANLANICLADTNEITNDEKDEDLEKIYNTPIVFNTTSTAQVSSRKHFCYASESAVALKAYYWCVYQPQFGHFMQSARQNSIPFEVVIAVDNDQSNRDMLQSYWEIPIIHPRLTDLIQYYTITVNPPTIQGYYISAPESILGETNKQFLSMQTTCIDLLLKCSNLETFVFEYRDNFSKYSIEQFCNLHRSKGWTMTNHLINSSDHSDRVSTSLNIIFAINKKDQSTVQPFRLAILQPPLKPNSLGECVHEEFNDSKHSIPYVGTHFKIEHCAESQLRQPSVELYLRPTRLAPVDLGYQVFSKNHPAPLPTTNVAGFFGPLFGLSFKKGPDIFIRCISTSEYIKTFGYDNNYSYELSTKNSIIDKLRSTIPARTMHSITEAIYSYLHEVREQRILVNADRFSIDLSVPALFSGITKDELPDAFAWKQAYHTDEQCNLMLQMISNPAMINSIKLQSIDSIYRSPMRNSQIKLVDQRLCYLEPVANSTKTIKLIIVPHDLRHHVFVCFHANPLGSHFSLYYTLHRIRLRFHWPNMYSYIKKAIEICAGCMLKNHSARPGSELLYSFPIDAPFMTVHADLWVPGKTTSSEGYIGLMIVMCHMTGFVAIEPIKDSNAREFARAIYKVQLRYGLSHLLITDSDSKFKGAFTNAAILLKIKHHMTARGNHNAILVERFNRFLNSTLKVFNNDHESNRVFVEGALMSAYAWNSAPVAGTDLSRSLLVLGREFHFPIDFTSRQHITFQLTDKDVQSYASDMLNLMEKSQEIYKLLIDEHRAYHRELRNAQISHPRQFKVGDVVFARAQVQSIASRGQVKKLRYATRGPYKVISNLPSGSYEIQLLKSKTVIKKHGSDLFLSPLVINPYQPIKQSDQAFGDLNKKSSANPYAVADIDGFNPSQPWGAPAALSLVREAELGYHHFPTVEELDADYDSWPESGNPFSNVFESSISGKIQKEAGLATGTQLKHDTDHIVALPSTLPRASTPASFPNLIRDIIASEDKLFFIAYSPGNDTRKEWKLVQLDFEKTMQLHPSCLQNGKFLVNFFIQHHNDDGVNLTDKRYWLEYHLANSAHTLSSKYHLLTPSAVSQKIAHNKNLVPYREWTHLLHENTIIHGPFNFSTINGRKSRDRINAVDWDILISCKTQYDCQPPCYTHHTVQVNWLENAHEIMNDKAVENRILSFHFGMHFNDETLSAYGHTG